jgi:plasmid maintenance system antidote protein VapI
MRGNFLLTNMFLYGNILSMNTLNALRKKLDLSFAALGKVAGYPRPTVWRHCQPGVVITAEAAFRYARALGVPISELRPDLTLPQ